MSETGESSEVWLDVLGQHGHDGKLCLEVRSGAAAVRVEALVPCMYLGCAQTRGLWE